MIYFSDIQVGELISAHLIKEVSVVKILKTRGTSVQSLLVPGKRTGKSESKGAFSLERL